MMRLWLPFGRRVLVLVTILIALVLLFPLRLAVAILGLDAEGMTARDVSGSVWGGRIEALNVSGVALGSVDAALSPFHLLIGEARIAVSRSSGAEALGPVSGAVIVSRNSQGIAGLNAMIPLGAALAPLPVGAVTTTGLTVRFENGACVRAGGNVRAALSGSFAGVALAQGLSGDVNCNGHYVRVPLASQSGQERLDLRIAATGDYVADLIAAEPAADRVPALAALGFQAAPGGYRLRVTGRFR